MYRGGRSWECVIASFTPYFDIDLRIVWDTVHINLPVLIAQLEPLAPPED